MSTADNNNVKMTGTEVGNGLGFCGGGPVMSGYGVSFLSTGGSLEVYQLDRNGNNIPFANSSGTGYRLYALPSGTVIGTLALGMTSGASTGAGTFLADIDARCVGLVGYCRTAPIQVGRGGLPKLAPSGMPNVFPFVGATATPDVLSVGDFIEWSIVAGSHGYKLNGASTGGSGITETNSTFIEGSEGTTSNAQTFTITSITPWVALTTGATTLTSRAGVHIVNLGTLDLEVGTTLNLARWVVPAGSDRYIPIATGKTLYAAGVGGSATSIYATEYGF